MNMIPARGWKAREAAGRAKLEAGIPQHIADNLRIAADRLQAEREAAEAHKAEIARQHLETACPCPTCDGGKKVLSVEEAAFVASAVAFYRAHAYATDPYQIRVQNQRIANPNHVVIGANVVDPKAYDNAINLGEHLAAQSTTAGEASTDEEALAELVSETPRKAKPRHVVPPHLSDE